MTSPVPLAAEKIDIGGIKLSDLLVLLSGPVQSDTSPWEPALIRALAVQRISMPLLTLTGEGLGARLICCVAERHRRPLADLLHTDPLLAGVTVHPEPVGLVSLFPHRNRMALLGRALCALGEANLPVYGMSSSVASLVFIIDHSRLNQALAALLAHLRLPANHTPPDPG